MAEGKKGFILYADQKDLFEYLDDEMAGKLIKHVFKYVNDENPVSDDSILNVAFMSIKTQLKRDLKKWENIVERNRVNGKKGGRPKNPKKPTGLFGNPKEPKKADKDNDKDNVIDINTIDEDTFYTLDVLKDFYLKDIRLINAVCESLNTTDEIILKRLNDFNIHLNSEGVHAKTWNDYTKHFRNWFKLTKEEKKPNEKEFMTYAMGILGGKESESYKAIRSKLITTYKGWDKNKWIGFNSKPITDWKAALNNQITFLSK